MIAACARPLGRALTGGSGGLAAAPASNAAGVRGGHVGTGNNGAGAGNTWTGNKGNGPNATTAGKACCGPRSGDGGTGTGLTIDAGGGGIEDGFGIVNGASPAATEPGSTTLGAAPAARK